MWTVPRERTRLNEIDLTGCTKNLCRLQFSVTTCNEVYNRNLTKGRKIKKKLHMGKETSLQPVISQSYVSVPGYGCAEFRCIPQKVSSADESHPIKLKTMNSRLYFTHPLKLLVTRQFSPHCLAQSDCQWIYKVQSGGSHTSLNIDVGENCKVVFTTQEYPKILASDDDSIGEQHLKVHVADGAILAVLPDPIICYKNAKFQQEQVFHLTSNANLILLDWLIAGRIALGEIWEMISFASESKVYVDGKLVHGDAIRLDRDLVNVKDNMCSLQKALEYTKVLGSCVFIGPQFRELKWKIQEKVKSLSDPSDGFTVSASVLNQPLCDGVVIKLLAAQSTEQARSFFRSVIEDTREWLGSNPLEK